MDEAGTARIGESDGGGADGGGPSNRKYLRHQREILRNITHLRELHPELLDVTFVVGFEGEEKREFKANSTVLSLKSDYFKTMCYGPMRQPDTAKIIDDMEPRVFEKVLEFAHASAGCMDIANLEEAWSVRYAASQGCMLSNHIL